MASIAEARQSNEKKAAWILAIIAIVEGAWLFLNIHSNPRGFFRFSGMLPIRGGLFGWMLAILVAMLFLYASARFPSVRANFLRLSYLKMLGIAVAVCSGFCEEIIFRKIWMDYLQRRGLAVVLQVLLSAVAFGLAHAVWAFFRGRLSAGFGAAIATGLLGLALAIVYVVSGRVVAPCIVSHLLINLFAEPGLVLAAVSGEMGAVRYGSGKPA